jgi:TetR/AcrR family transcriptional regulator
MERKHAARRDRIVAAARSEFAGAGLGGATMRGIARTAGVTTGAIYPYFASKEELYAAVLQESLRNLSDHVAGCISAAAPGDRGREALRGFFGFYRARPDELALGLYLFDGIGPSGLEPVLDRRLNASLREVFDRAEQAFASDGREDAARRTAGGVAQIIGLLMMERTGRLKLFGAGPEELFAAYLQE